MPPVFLLLRGTSDALCRIGDCFQTGLGDFPAAGFALTVAAVIDSPYCRINLIDRVLLISQQTQREFLVEVVAAKLCHTGGHAGGLAVVAVQGIVGHLGHVALESGPQRQKFFPMKREVLFRHYMKPWIR